MCLTAWVHKTVENYKGLALTHCSNKASYNLLADSCGHAKQLNSADFMPDVSTVCEVLSYKYRIFRSDTVATIYFAARFVRLLFEGGYYSRAATV